jgi:hypothetical protein
MAGSFFAPLIAPMRPHAVFGSGDAPIRPIAASGGVLLWTLASAALMIPFIRAQIDSAPIPPIEPETLSRILWFNIGALAPIGALLYVALVACALWTIPAFVGYDTQFKRCFFIAAGASGVDVMRRLLVVGILWLREWTGLVDPSYQVRVGFDAFVGDPSALLGVIARHLGVFDVWSIALATVGLMTLERLPRRLAILTSCATVLFFEGVVIGLELLR